MYSGNAHIQAHLVNTLRRDILCHRQSIQMALTNQLSFDIKKIKMTDEHFAAQKKALARTAEASKRHIAEHQCIYTYRGKLAMDMVSEDIDRKFCKLQKDMNDSMESLKNGSEHSMAVVEHSMAVRKSTTHFFKQLYESSPSKPVGETLDMLRSNE